jgi:hypothetical protein
MGFIPRRVVWVKFIGGEDGQVIDLGTLHDLLRAELLLSKEH